MGTPEENRNSFTLGCLLFVAVVAVLLIVALRNVIGVAITMWAGLF